MHNQKQHIRDAFMTRRGRMKSRDVTQASRSIISTLLQDDRVGGAKHVCTYVSQENEVDTHELIITLLRAKTIVSVPRMLPDRSLELVRVTSLAQARDYSAVARLPAVTITASHAVSNDRPEIVIVPIVACDSQRNRIGRGGGSYDRLISAFSVPDIPFDSGYASLFIGLAYDWQVIAGIAADPWDRKLDLIITETRTIA